MILGRKAERQNRLNAHKDLLRRQVEEAEREKARRKEEARLADIRDQERVKREMEELARLRSLSVFVEVCGLGALVYGP